MKAEDKFWVDRCCETIIERTKDVESLDETMKIAHKLIYDWVKTSHISLKQFNALLSYLYDSSEMFSLKYGVKKDSLGHFEQNLP